MSRDPEFMHLEGGVEADAIRLLLRELGDRNDTSLSTRRPVVELATLNPVDRMIRNMQQTVECMRREQVTSILHNGVSLRERDMLVELDDLKYSQVARATARGLLNVKERWFMIKSIRGFFKKARVSDAYIYTNPEAGE